jgi:hypothetical protein
LIALLGGIFHLTLHFLASLISTVISQLHAPRVVRKSSAGNFRIFFLIATLLHKHAIHAVGKPSDNR